MLGGRNGRDLGRSRLPARAQANATAPPRRGSPPPEYSPVSGSLTTAWTPPKKRFAATSGPPGSRGASTRARPASSTPGSAWTRPSSKWILGERDRLGGVHPLLDDPDRHVEDRRADSVRAGAAEAEHDLAVAQGDGRGHHRADPAAGRDPVESAGVQVLLAEHVVDVHAGAGDDQPRAGAVGAGDRGAHAVGVQSGEVGGGPEAVPLRGRCRAASGRSPRRGGPRRTRRCAARWPPPSPRRAARPPVRSPSASSISSA